MSSPALSLAGVSRGDPWHPASASGVAKHLFDELEARYVSAGRVNVELTRLQRGLVAARTVHPSRRSWYERFYKNPLAFELQSRNSGRLLARFRPFDLAVQVHALFQTRGAPYVLHADTTAALSRRHWPEWSTGSARGAVAADAREQHTYHEARHLFAFTDDVAASFVDDYGIDEQRISVVGGGLNFDELPDLPAVPTEPIVLFVGRDWRRKGGDVLVEAFRRMRSEHPTAKLVVVGTTEPSPEPGIEVHGALDRAAVASLYRRATVFALPSHYEPYGLAVCEAMAHGLPCVGTSAGGMSAIIVEGVTGHLVPPANANALAAALSRLLSDRARARAMGSAGRERVRLELTWGRVVDRMSGPLEQAAAEVRSSARSASR